MGNCGGFGYALWATAWNEAVQKKPMTNSTLWATAQDFADALWVKVQDFVLCYMCHRAGFCYAPGAIAQDLVMVYGPWRQTTSNFFSLPNSLKGQ